MPSFIGWLVLGLVTTFVGSLFLMLVRKNDCRFDLATADKVRKNKAMSVIILLSGLVMVAVAYKAADAQYSGGTGDGASVLVILSALFVLMFGSLLGVRLARPK